MPIITLDLPYPPSVNHYWMTRGKMRFISQRGKEFRALVVEAAAECGVKLDGRLSIFLSMYPPDRRRRDLDNTLKAVLDALAHAGCYEDDEQIDEIHIVRKPVLRGGRCKVVISTGALSSIS